MFLCVYMMPVSGLFAPQGRLELPSLAPEANTLSTELLGRKAERFYHNYTIARGANAISSDRRRSMIKVLPLSSPTTSR